MSGSSVTPKLLETIKYYATFPQKCVTLRQMIDFGNGDLRIYWAPLDGESPLFYAFLSSILLLLLLLLLFSLSRKWRLEEFVNGLGEFFFFGDNSLINLSHYINGFLN